MTGIVIDAGLPLTSELLSIADLVTNGTPQDRILMTVAVSDLQLTVITTDGGAPVVEPATARRSRTSCGP